MPRTRSNKKQGASTRRAFADDGGDKDRASAASKDVASDGVTSPPMLGNSVVDSPRLQPIRLAGANCLSLDALLNDASTDGLALADTQATRDADLIPCLNLREVTKAAQLTRLEYRALLHAQKGVPLYKLAKALRCRPCEAKRALQTAQLKVRNFQRGFQIGGVERDRLIDYIPVPDSVRLTYRERSVRGQPYALISLSEAFAEIMAEEKFSSLLSERDPSSYEKRRASLGAMIGRVKLSFNGEVLEAEVRLEVFKLSPMRPWRSEQALHDLATDIVRRRNRDEAEAGERERIHALPGGELDEAEKTCCARISVLRENIPTDEKKLERLTKQLRERQSNSGTVAREEIVERVERNREDLRTESWRNGVIREEQAYRARRVLEPEVFAALNSKEAKAARKSNIEHMQRTRALIARRAASNPSAVANLAGLDRVLGDAMALLRWIDRIDPEGKLSAQGI